MSSDERHHLDGEQWEMLRDDVPALTSAVSGVGTSGVNREATSRVQYVHAALVRLFHLKGEPPPFSPAAKVKEWEQTLSVLPGYATV
jgi:hypothetical protein